VGRRRNSRGWDHARRDSPAAEEHATSLPEVTAEALAAIPLHRFADPETEIGEAVVFLCTPAAAFITGTTLPLDGGIAYLR
jgi:meso-butanediol dehydrogenase/(S,S)-butanediol dehydrogenase/diacetyl reductase